MVLLERRGRNSDEIGRAVLLAVVDHELNRVIALLVGKEVRLRRVDIHQLRGTPHGNRVERPLVGQSLALGIAGRPAVEPRVVAGVHLAIGAGIGDRRVVGRQVDPGSEAVVGFVALDQLPRAGPDVVGHHGHLVTRHHGCVPFDADIFEMSRRQCVCRPRCADERAACGRIAVVERDRDVGRYAFRPAIAHASREHGLVRQAATIHTQPGRAHVESVPRSRRPVEAPALNVVPFVVFIDDFAAVHKGHHRVVPEQRRAFHGHGQRAQPVLRHAGCHVPPPQHLVGTVRVGVIQIRVLKHGHREGHRHRVVAVVGDLHDDRTGDFARLAVDRHVRRRDSCWGHVHEQPAFRQYEDIKHLVGEGSVRIGGTQRDTVHSHIGRARQPREFARIRVDVHRCGTGLEREGRRVAVHVRHGRFVAVGFVLRHGDRRRGGEHRRCVDDLHQLAGHPYPAVVVTNGQRQHIVALCPVEVRHDDPCGTELVAEVPLVVQGIAVGIRGAGPVEDELVHRVLTGLRDIDPRHGRPVRRRHRYLKRIGILPTPAVVDHQGSGVGSRGRVRVRGRRQRAVGQSVAPIPGVVEPVPVKVIRSRTVQRECLSQADGKLRPVRHNRHGRAVRAFNRDLRLVPGLPAVAVVDEERDQVLAPGRVGMGRIRVRGREPVAEVPGVPQGVPVGVAGACGAEGHGLPLKRFVRPISLGHGAMVCSGEDDKRVAHHGAVFAVGHFRRHGVRSLLAGPGNEGQRPARCLDRHACGVLEQGEDQRVVVGIAGFQRFRVGQTDEGSGRRTIDKGGPEVVEAALVRQGRDGRRDSDRSPLPPAVRINPVEVLDIQIDRPIEERRVGIGGSADFLEPAVRTDSAAHDHAHVAKLRPRQLAFVLFRAHPQIVHDEVVHANIRKVGVRQVRFAALGVHVRRPVGHAQPDVVVSRRGKAACQKGLLPVHPVVEIQGLLEIHLPVPVRDRVAIGHVNVKRARPVEQEILPDSHDVGSAGVGRRRVRRHRAGDTHIGRVVERRRTVVPHLKRDGVGPEGAECIRHDRSHGIGRIEVDAVARIEIPTPLDDLVRRVHVERPACVEHDGIPHPRGIGPGMNDGNRSLLEQRA